MHAPEKDWDLRSVRKRGAALGMADGGTGMKAAFPIRVGDAAIAALTIDGPVLEGPPDPDSSPFSDWLLIVTHLESLAHAQPALFENPFAHIDPDTILGAPIMAGALSFRMAYDFKGRTQKEAP